LQLAGILRLANGLVAAAQSSEIRPQISRADGIIRISAQGIDNRIGLEGERLARSKYLLEVAGQVAIEIRNQPATGPEPANARASLRRDASRNGSLRASKT
jgi:hypothetical protein